MSHQPPIPEASQSPYPLHSEPIVHDAPTRALVVVGDEDTPTSSRFSIFAVSAALGAGAAALAGLLYARRRSRSRSSSDIKPNRSAADRKRVAAEQPYEVQYFARKHRISADEARSIIKQAGPSRNAANALAERRKA